MENKKHSNKKYPRKRKHSKKVHFYQPKRRKLEAENEIKELDKQLEKFYSIIQTVLYHSIRMLFQWNTAPENFEDFPLSQKTQRGLKDCNYVTFTSIQSKSILPALKGHNVWGKAKTGSGKTLAFVIPVLEKLYKEGWSKEFGVGAIILSPTAELAKQTYDVFNKVGRYHSFSIALVIGGGNKVKQEKERVGQISILICTPGRLVQHINENPDLRCDDLQMLGNCPMFTLYSPAVDSLDPIDT
ncbi:hypothetical protein LAZ67_17002266 [Cordylochernes scorpioides]|uniref:ATP-dependent RNA helicase n=1 Tax=Cordylochernes scorpioides TaxID=51811 RepID=A0ABY6LF94_9ARAC|nr:hypothetical protein LAZ67_17002266 [Cordylochernes scorpioides]